MLDISSLAATAVVIGANQILAPVPCLRNEHSIYPTDAARIKDAWNPDVGNPYLLNFQGTLDARGNSLYLPYKNDTITSLRLPIPPPAGVDFFLTANMSGCKLFIDKIVGSNDLIVYHANTLKFPTPAHGSPVNDQSPFANRELDSLHSNAQADYRVAPHNLAPIQVKSLAKPEYYQVGALEEQRKADQGRTLDLIDKNQNPISVPPEFGGGCSIVAYYSGGAWTFYYQTWGSLTYDRPAGVTAIAKNLLTGHWNYVHKARVEGKDHKQKPYKFFKALEYVKFYP